MQLGRLGVWNPNDRLSPPELIRLLKVSDDLGYSALWYPEAVGYEAFSSASFMLAHSDTLKIGSSIANIYARDPFTARRGLIGMNRMYGDRFVLGLGVSHAPMVEARGHGYAKPVPAMRDYPDRMQQDAQDSGEWQVMLAALGPVMMRLAFERSMGALPANSTPEHTRRAAAVMPPGKHLAVAEKFIFETDADRARTIGRGELAPYLAMPNYVSHWQRLGYTEAELSGGGADRFIDAMVNWGTVEQVKQQVRAHFHAGATHVCIRPVHADGDYAARDAMLKVMANL